MTVPDVTVVTVTYDAAALVTTCLDALATQRLGGLVADVVVVDNASHDGTADVVAARGDVHLVRSGRNLGFAGGNNLALRDVRSRYVVLLNNDAVPEPDFVATLVAAMDAADPAVAAMAATVLLAERFRPAGPEDHQIVEGPDGRWTPDPAGPVRLVNSTGNQVTVTGFGIDRGWLADASRHHPGRDVFGVSGAASILRTSALREVGLLDESFFMYYEDTDLCWRLRLAGFRVEWCESAVVSHVHSATAREGSDFFVRHDARNRLATLTKNATAGLLARALARYLATTASLALRRGRWHLAGLRLRALASWLGMLPGLVRSRRRIGRAARVARADVERLLVVPPAASGPYRHR